MNNLIRSKKRWGNDREIDLDAVVEEVQDQFNQEEKNRKNQVQMIPSHDEVIDTDYYSCNFFCSASSIHLLSPII